MNTDQRVAAGKPVTPTFLFALLLYGPFAEIIEKQPQEKWHDIGTIVDAVDRAARQAQGRISIPKRFSLGVREMFAAQPRLEQPRGRRALRMLEQPRFRAGFDLLLLRAEMGLASKELADWWTRVQEVSQTDRDRMADALLRNNAARVMAVARAAVRADGASVGEGTHPRPHERSGDGAASSLPRWFPAYVGVGSNLAEPASQVKRALEALGGLPAQPPRGDVRRCIARGPTAMWCSRRS